MSLNFDFTFENEIRRAGEGDVLKRLIAGFFEADFQSIATFDIDLDRAGSAG